MRLEKKSKDIGMGIRKTIVVSFLLCFIGDSIPMCICLFKYFFVTCFDCFLLFFEGEKVW